METDIKTHIMQRLRDLRTPSPKRDVSIKSLPIGHMNPTEEEAERA